MEQNIVVDGKKIGRNSPVYIVAEMSANHLQDKKRAKEIIKAAKESGADAVKLQTYRPDTLTIDCPKKEFLASAGGPWSGMYLNCTRRHICRGSGTGNYLIMQKKSELPVFPRRLI